MAKFQGQVGESITIRIKDANQYLLDEWTRTISIKGQFEKILDVHRLPPGLYYIENTNTDRVMNKQFR